MTPVRRSSRRIKKEPPEETNVKQNVSKELDRARKLRTRKAVVEEKKIVEEIKPLPPKTPSHIRKDVQESQSSSGTEENERPRRKRKKLKEEEKSMSAVQAVQKPKEQPKKPREVKKAVTTPVSRGDRRPVLRDVHPEQVPEIFQKQHTAVKKTGSFTETFPGRLAWKKKHYDKPVTSTPVPQKTGPADPKEQIEQDVHDCFGFNSDDEPEEILEYSTLISPIAKVDKKPTENVIVYKRVPDPVKELQQEEHKADFSELLHKYHPESEEKEDEELCFNPYSVKATYGNKHKVVRLPPVTRRSNRKSVKSGSIKAISKSQKPARLVKTKRKKKEEELDAQAQKWLEEKTKEFEEIDRIPLLIEKSPQAAVPEQECTTT